MSVHVLLWGGGGVNACYTLFYNVEILLHCIFIWGSLKINIFKVIFWEGAQGGREGVTQKNEHSNVSSASAATTKMEALFYRETEPGNRVLLFPVREKSGNRPLAR